MTDLCEEEINSIESVFPGKFNITKKHISNFWKISTVCKRYSRAWMKNHELGRTIYITERLPFVIATIWLICLITFIFRLPGVIVWFHCEQAWERWTSKKDNRVSHSRETLLSLMRQIPRSRTEECFENSLRNLLETTDWKANANLRRWFANT